jgi:hypothetical protein
MSMNGYDSVLMLEDMDLSNIQDANARQLIVRLMNLIEAVTTDLRDQHAGRRTESALQHRVQPAVHYLHYHAE